MMRVKDSSKKAKDNEAIFRNILMDIKENPETKLCGAKVLNDLNPELSIEDVYETNSAVKEKRNLKDIVRNSMS